MPQGHVRVGVPDELRPEYTSWFIEGDVPFLTEVVARPEYLKVQESSTLDLRVMVVSCYVLVTTFC